MTAPLVTITNHGPKHVRIEAANLETGRLSCVVYLPPGQSEQLHIPFTHGLMVMDAPNPPTTEKKERALTLKNDMPRYIGTKIIQPVPMTRAEYNAYRGWTLPADENGADEGFLVEYLDGGKGNHPNHAGYISWSPKEVFERAYRCVKAMTFGDALVLLKEGHKVARAGWNGKDMWLSLSGPLEGRAVPAMSFWSENNANYARQQETGFAKVLPCITMKTATGEILMGWLASQSDMLAEDWTVVA